LTVILQRRIQDRVRPDSSGFRFLYPGEFVSGYPGFAQEPVSYNDLGDQQAPPDSKPRPSTRALRFFSNTEHPSHSGIALDN